MWKYLGLLCGGLAVSVLSVSCKAPASSEKPRAGGTAMNIAVEPFGTTADGKPVSRYTLTNGKGMRVRIITYGAIIQSIEVPDRTGKLADVTLGFDTLEGYLGRHPYFGSIVGRYANRIGGAKFTLDGKTYSLAKNNGGNHLHGGLKGFDKVIWDAEEIRGDDWVGVKLHYLSPDMEEGYPGNLSVTVTYKLNSKNELWIDYKATTDKPTVINLTNHAYFNLKGQGEGDILGHIVTINADRFTPVDAGLIPTGEIRSVKGTPLDFTEPHPIGERINSDYEQIKLGKGYDHNFVLNGKPGELRLAARVVEPSTGRVLEVLTTQPGMQFYTGNFLDGSNVGKGGKIYKHRYGFCLETQHFPDSPNKPDFPSVVLRPGETYHETTVFRFSTE